jgi:nitric oxide dioxygenase
MRQFIAQEPVMTSARGHHTGPGIAARLPNHPIKALLSVHDRTGAVSAALNDKTIDIVKSTVPPLEAGGTAMTERMCQRLFRNPEIRYLFNQSHHGETRSQSKALTAAVIAYARNIDNLGVLASRVERITQKHVGLNIRPEHYPHVAEALLGAIKEVLGDAATDEVLAAWGEAYWFLADLLMARGASLYACLAGAPGGWSGWRDFVVESTTPESEIIRSFILAPADGGAVIRRRSGQHLTFDLDAPGAGRLKRNYSISSAPEDRRYRISVSATAGRPGTCMAPRAAECTPWRGGCWSSPGGRRT